MKPETLEPATIGTTHSATLRYEVDIVLGRGGEPNRWAPKQDGKAVLRWEGAVLEVERVEMYGAFVTFGRGLKGSEVKFWLEGGAVLELLVDEWSDELALDGPVPCAVTTYSWTVWS